MSEKQQGLEHPDPKKQASFVNTILVSSLVGTMFGLPAYLVARLLTDPETAQKWGLGVGIGTAATGIGIQLSHLSMERAERFAKAGRTLRARLEVARVVVEGTAGFGVAGGIITLATENVLPTIASLLLGGIGTYFAYREQVKPFPNLITPGCDSVKRDISFPESIKGHRYPPVFQADSLKDVLEFREVNKAPIVHWATSIPNRSADPNSLTATMLTTSVFILPNIRHFPGYDPKINQDMRLYDAADMKTDIIVHPNKHTFLTWPIQTIFEDKFGESIYFNDKYWQAWREASWREKVVLLVQYQSSGTWKLAPEPENVSDNYWLLDILTDKQNQRPAVRRRVPQPHRRIIPALAPRQI